jgi:nicotinamide mononucleotide transporter
VTSGTPVGEVAANVCNVASIVLAGRNSVHTWWTGIFGCLLFAWVFFEAHLYADVSLQAFFVITGLLGWHHWEAGQPGAPLAIRRSSPRLLCAGSLAALAVTAGYAWLLRRFTDAFAPFWDSVVLTFSVFGQLLLMGRRIDTWWCWLVVNSVAVPLYAVRGLWLTAVLYALFWINALVSLRHWRKLALATAGG